MPAAPKRWAFINNKLKNERRNKTVIHRPRKSYSKKVSMNVYDFEKCEK